MQKGAALTAPFAFPTAGIRRSSVDSPRSSWLL